MSFLDKQTRFVSFCILKPPPTPFNTRGHLFHVFNLKVVRLERKVDRGAVNVDRVELHTLTHTVRHNYIKQQHMVYKDLKVGGRSVNNLQLLVGIEVTKAIASIS